MHEDKPHGALPDEPELRVKALESLLISKRLVDPETLDAIVDYYSNAVGPLNGARVVAKAWSDPGFRRFLLEDASSAAASLGFSGRQGEHIVAVENTLEIHNLVVCTLCSCYPWPLLGIPPSWYKSDAYRKRAVREPRKVLSEFGLHIPSKQRIRIWDSTSEVRYLVVPMRPDRTDGLDEQELARLVTRDSMIGTGLPECPESLK